MNRQRVVAAVLAVLVPVAGVGAAVLIGGGTDEGPAPLPVAGGAGTTEEGRAAADAALSFAGPITYELGPDVPTLDGSARAWQLTGDGEAVARRLAGALGLPADAITSDEFGWHVDDGTHLLDVARPIPSWSYYRIDPAGGAGSSSGMGMSEPAEPTDGADAAGSGEWTAAPERPADLPAQEEAEAIALDLVRAIGLDVEGARVQTYDNVTAWSVNVDPLVDGRPTFGFTQSVNVGPGGEVLDAYGVAGTPEPGDEYPLIGTSAAVERLRQGRGFGGMAASTGSAPPSASSAAGGQPVTTVPPGVAPDTPVSSGSAGEPATTTAVADADASASPTTVCIMIYPPPPGCEGGAAPQPTTVPPPAPEPVVVELVDAEVGLAFVPAADGSRAYLVPAYLFTTGDGGMETVLALPDEFLEQPDPDDGSSGGGGDEPGSGGGGDTPATEPAPYDGCVLTEGDASGTTHTVDICPPGVPPSTTTTG